MSPRQKMINMMYIVLMAMLALNVSVEVLDAFVDINKTVEQTTEQFAEKNGILYSDLAQKSQNNANKFKAKYDLAMQIKADADNMVARLDQYKADIMIKAGAVPETYKVGDPLGADFEAGSLQSTATAGEYFFPGDVLNENGKEFVSLMDGFRTNAAKAASDSSLVNRINSIFSTDKVEVKGSGGVKQEWIKSKFSHYPAAAALTFISQIQADIRNTEADLVSDLAGAASGNVKMQATDVSAIEKPVSTSIIQGGEYKSQVILAATDPTITPSVVIFPVDANGKKIGKEVPQKVVNGVGQIKIPANSVGIKKWGGMLSYKSDAGEVVRSPFDVNFEVTKPSAVVSATKMNVVYRGVDNPIDVSVPGVSANDITLSGPGSRKVGPGKYMIKLTSGKAKEVKYSVTAKMPSGETKSMGTQVFRVKDIPAPAVALKGLKADADVGSTLVKRTVEVKLDGFDFPVQMVVTQFDVKVEGAAPMTVKGNKFSSKAASLIKKSRKKDLIIRNVKYSIKGVSVPSKKVSPFVVKIK